MEKKNQIINSGDVYIDNGNIVAVDPESPPFHKEVADKTIHAENSLLLPGFVNAHGHLARGLFRGLSEFVYGHPWDECFARSVELSKLLEPDDYYFGTFLVTTQRARE